MYINQIQDNNISTKGIGDIPKHWKRFKQGAIDLIPNISLKDTANLDTYNKITEVCAHPVYNKLILSGTALATQPFIDNCNKELDEKTRKVSVCRTIAKIIAGTFVGIIVRGGSYECIKKLTDLNSNKSYNKLLIPERYFNTFATNTKLLKNHRSTLSTIIALAVMSVTNILLDAPLTVYLTNKFTKNINNKKNLTNSKEVSNV